MDTTADATIHFFLPFFFFEFEETCTSAGAGAGAREGAFAVDGSDDVVPGLVVLSGETHSWFTAKRLEGDAGASSNFTVVGGAGMLSGASFVAEREASEEASALTSGSEYGTSPLLAISTSAAR